MSKNVSNNSQLGKVNRKFFGIEPNFSFLRTQTMSKSYFKLNFYRCRNSVENNGFEPMTPCVQGRCSSQLS